MPAVRLCALLSLMLVLRGGVPAASSNAESPRRPDLTRVLPMRRGHIDPELLRNSPQRASSRGMAYPAGSWWTTVARGVPMR